VFENKVLRTIEEWRKSHNEEIHNVFSAPNMITMIKSRDSVWAERVACIGSRASADETSIRKPEGKTTSET
jgi:hypothetical protein